MKTHFVRQIPLLDEAGRPVGLASLDDLIQPDPVPLHAVVMAGGFGTRLAPLTHHVPKPMLPVGDRPMLEHIIEQLGHAGVPHVHIATHHLPEVIEDHFGDGTAFGMRIDYVREDEPMGTAGAIGLLDVQDAPLLVVNGDVLTDVNYRAMLDFHLEHGADLTVAARSYEIQVPFGILDCRGPSVRAVREKPKQTFFVSAGIYLLSPSVRNDIPVGQRVDMPELIERVIHRGGAVVNFPIIEYWLDIGRPSQYRQAQADLRRGSLRKSERQTAVPVAVGTPA
jgi:NDP-sugar pyrophosphorylase family protein